MNIPIAATAFLAGSLTTLSPCVLPVLPLVMSSALSESPFGPLFLCLGLSLSFSLLTWSVASFGQFLFVNGSALKIFVGVTFLLSGATLLIPSLQDAASRLFSPASQGADAISKRVSFMGNAGQFFQGLMLGLIWTPCSGPALGAAIGLASQAKGSLPALAVLVVFSLGAIWPLLLVAYSSQSFRKWFQAKMATNGIFMKKSLGALVMVVGALLVSGMDKQLEAVLLRYMPDFLIDLTTKY